MTDREIYEELRGPLMRFATSLVGPSDAADLVSEAVVSTLRRHRLSSLAQPQAYLMQAIVNRARSHGRRRRREMSAMARHGVDLPTESADPGSDVVRAVFRLPMQQRAAVFLVYWEGWSPTEAAGLLGLRPGTLRRYLHLALRTLKRFLDDR